MNLAIDVLLHAGRSAVDVALYTLLPIMILMMIVMRARVDECLRSVRNPKSGG